MERREGEGERKAEGRWRGEGEKGENKKWVEKGELLGEKKKGRLRRGGRERMRNGLIEVKKDWEKERYGEAGGKKRG